MEETPVDVFIPVSEAARLLCVTPQTIRRAVRNGQIPAERRGNLWYVPASALADLSFRAATGKKSKRKLSILP